MKCASTAAPHAVNSSTRTSTHACTRSSPCGTSLTSNACDSRDSSRYGIDDRHDRRSVAPASGPALVCPGMPWYHALITRTRRSKRQPRSARSERHLAILGKCTGRDHARTSHHDHTSYQNQSHPPRSGPPKARYGAACSHNVQHGISPRRRAAAPPVNRASRHRNSAYPVC